MGACCRAVIPWHNASAQRSWQACETHTGNASKHADNSWMLAEDTMTCNTSTQASLSIAPVAVLPCSELMCSVTTSHPATSKCVPSAYPPVTKLLPELLSERAQGHHLQPCHSPQHTAQVAVPKAWQLCLHLHQQCLSKPIRQAVVELG